MKPTDKELAEAMRGLAEVARSSEHRPVPCPICDLASLAEEAADRLEAKAE